MHTPSCIRTLTILLFAGLLAATVSAQHQNTRTGTKSSASPKAVSLDAALRALPADGAVQGWKRTGAALVYPMERLHEAIDGAAETYRTLGCAGMAGVELANGSRRITIEIYRMHRAGAAANILAQERAAQCTPVRIGDEGWSDVAMLAFRQGAHYVKLLAFTPDPHSRNTLRKLAALTARALKQR